MTGCLMIGESRAEFRSAEDAQKFALAGDAVLTLQSRRTGNHYTYGIRKPNDIEDRLFVQVLLGDGHFRYIGQIRLPAKIFSTTKKSKLADESLQVRGFRYFWDHLVEGHLPDDMMVLHEGRCGRCGRPLTNPESIRTGLGPICVGLD